MAGSIKSRDLGYVGFIFVFLLALTIGTVTQVGAVPFTASLDSAQEVFPAGQSNSPLTGSAQLEIQQSGGVYSLSFSITFDSGFDFGPVTGNPSTGGEEVTNLHFHNNVRGANGPVVFGIFGPSSDLDGDTSTIFNPTGTTTVLGEWDEAEGNGGATLADFIPDLLSAQANGGEAPLYLNLHSVTDRAGVIRGQLSPVPEPGTFLLLGAGLSGLGLWRWKQSVARDN